MMNLRDTLIDLAVRYGFQVLGASQRPRTLVPSWCHR